MKTKLLNYGTVHTLVLFALFFAVSLSGCKKDEMRDATEVLMENNTFSPATLTVQISTMVKWTNKDGMIHNVVSNDGLFDSGNINPGDVYMRMFTTAGTFNYQCTLHPGMVGKIVVQQPSSAADSSY